MKRILVTGGTGFIGSHLVRGLAKQGHLVRVLSLVHGRYFTPIPGVEYVEGSIGDHGALEQTLSDVDVVYHLAWNTAPSSSMGNMQADANDNLIGSINLFEACVRNKVAHVVFLSSGGTVYGKAQILPISELHPTNPLSAYGISKLAIEKYLMLFGHLYGQGFTILRGANVYGEEQNPDAQQGAVVVFLKHAILNETITIWGDGEVVRDYIHVDDLVNICLRTLDIGPTQQIFNAGTGVGVSLNQLLHMIGLLTGKCLRIQRQSERTYDVPKNILDCRKAAQVLKWEPKICLNEGLNRSLKWLSSVRF